MENGVVKLIKLSETLAHLSDNDFDNFYYGDIANEVLKTIEDEGGHATKKDFETYEIIHDSKFEQYFTNLDYKAMRYSWGLSSVYIHRRNHQK